MDDYTHNPCARELQPVFEAVAAEYGVNMSLESLHVTPGSMVTEIRFRGPLDYPNNLKLDISPEEKLVLEPVWGTIRTGYPDVPDFRVKAYSLKEILVEKLRSLMQRSRSRDYFDVWRLLSEKEFDLEEVRVLLIEKCRTRGVEYRPELIFDAIYATIALTDRVPDGVIVSTDSVWASSGWTPER